MVSTGLVVKLWNFCKGARQYEYSCGDRGLETYIITWINSGNATGHRFLPPNPQCFFTLKSGVTAHENLNKIGSTVIVLYRPCVSACEGHGEHKICFASTEIRFTVGPISSRNN